MNRSELKIFIHTFLWDTLYIWSYFSLKLGHFFGIPFRFMKADIGGF